MLKAFKNDISNIKMKNNRKSYEQRKETQRVEVSRHINRINVCV